MTHDQSVQTGNEVTDSVTSGTDLTPSHDPLCGSMKHHHPDDYPCDCDLCQRWCECERISEIRADTLEKARERVQASALIGMMLTDKEVRIILDAIVGES